jgi:hypothetical protein
MKQIKPIKNGFKEVKQSKKPPHNKTLETKHM